MKVSEFENVVMLENGGVPIETVLDDWSDTRNSAGPKHIFVKNTGQVSAIVRYYYGDCIKDTGGAGKIAPMYPVQKSLDTDPENLIAVGETKHILMEHSTFVETIKLTAIATAIAGLVTPATLSGKLMAPSSKFTSDLAKG